MFFDRLNKKCQIFILYLCILNILVPASPTAFEFNALEQAIRDLNETFPEKYPAADFLLRLEQVQQSLDQVAFETLRREALIANPLVNGQPILFVVREQYNNVHGTEETMYQTDQDHITEYFHGGGALKLLDPLSGEVKILLKSPQGIIRDPEVHFDGQRILFSMRQDSTDDYHIYEMDVSGENVRQLTYGSKISDIQPIYLPDDSIVFSSTRDPKYIPCQRHLMANLFSMNADGSNICQIGFNTQFEGRASLMPDGRILYTRWEYVDKHFSSAYGLWTVNPDGTNHALYYGGYGWQPGAILDGKIIPGTQQFVAIYGSVHDLAWGAMVIADRSRGLDGMAPILRSWPSDIGDYMTKWDIEDRVGGEYDSFGRIPIKYAKPFPLSEKYFLCVRQLSNKKHTGLFLVDIFGNEVLLHEEAPGCFDPVPLKSHPRPPVIPSRVDRSRDLGEFYVQNVYIGEYMDRVKPGSVKYLRVIEAPSKRTRVNYCAGDWAPYGSTDSHHPIALNWNHYNNKRILGTVPVEEDGSAYFTVPAGRFVYFQLLDENGMMIQSMRSGTMLQRGERTGCVGCHENRLESPPPSAFTLAMKQPPGKMNGWYGPERNFNYVAEVQSVLDRNCIRCHDYGGEAEKINLSGDKDLVFNHSYVNLMRSSPSNYVRTEHENPGTMPLVSSVGAGPVKVLPPYSWGSHRSRLVKMLRDGHQDVKLDPESFDRIITWIDLNAPYYPSHAAYYIYHTNGRSPLDHKQLLELGKLVLDSPGGASFGWDKVNEYTCDQLGRLMALYGPLVNFTRPEYSLSLQGFDDHSDPAYQRALELIEFGQHKLIEHPRCDMPGFVPCQHHQEQLDFLAECQQSLKTK